MIKDCSLRPIEESDLDRVLGWRNAEHIRAAMFTDQIITIDEHRAWYERLKKEESIKCLIFEIHGRPVGVVSIAQIDICSKKCSWGFYLGETCTPPGSGTAMGYLALNYIFINLQIRKLCGEVLASNIKSIDYHKKFGFIVEGRFVKHVLKNGRYEDVVAFALFGEDWLNLRRGIEKMLEGAVTGK